MIITCEQVSNGHPDKICDQIADAIVTDCLQHDSDSRVAIECMAKSDRIIIAGELTSTHKPDYEQLVCDVLNRLKRDASLPKGFSHDVTVLVQEQSPDIAMGVDRGGAGDQGMMYGYATDETPEMLPIPFAVATHALELLRDLNDPNLMADAKAQVSFDYDSGRITTFLISTQHSDAVTVNDIRPIVEAVMETAAQDYDLNTDFQRLVNPTGRFVIGGPFADCGVTGRKLACDTYGSIGRLGGGALSGKDPSKVDRSGAYMARRIAKDMVKYGFTSRCEIQIAYAIGVAEPVSVAVDCFGTETIPVEEILQHILGTYDLTPNGIICQLGLKDVDYNRVSAYGHFGKPGLPWED